MDSFVCVVQPWCIVLHSPSYPSTFHKVTGFKTADNHSPPPLLNILPILLFLSAGFTEFLCLKTTLGPALLLKRDPTEALVICDFN